MKTPMLKFASLLGALMLLFALGVPAYAADGDGDGVDDAIDNCLGKANADQRDTDHDGFGNRCDGDLNNDLDTNSLDLGLFKQKLGTADPNADFNGDGAVNAADTAILQQELYLKPPGQGGAPLSAAAAGIQALETTIQQINDNRVFTLAASLTIENKLFSIGANIKGASDGAFAQAKQASQSGGSSGNVEDLNTVETSLNDIRPRLDNAIVALQTIDTRLQAGEYTFDRNYIASLTLPERQDLLSQVTAAARAALIAQFPDLFPGAVGLAPTTGRPALAHSPCLACGMPSASADGGVGQRIADFFIPPAEAAAAYTCYNVCKNGNVWTVACATCIFKQGQNVINAWNTFKNCWNNAKSPFKAVKQALCLAQFLLIVA